MDLANAIKVYKGKEPILLSHLIVNPVHSILTQSYDTRLRVDLGRHNGDGFGIGYYTIPSLLPLLGPQPCIFTSTIPAWNCHNLNRLASKTVSPLVFAHVRAITEGSLAESNCHPFSRGSLMFMHNGGIGNWNEGIKRRLVNDVKDRWFNMVQGGTDSEWSFALFLDTLESMDYDPDSPEHQNDGFGHTVLRKAMLKTIQRINAYDKALGGEHKTSLLNFAITDGKSVVCTRYVSSKTAQAASLFFSSGTSWDRQPSADASSTTKGEYRVERRDRGADIVLVASEPLTFERGLSSPCWAIYKLMIDADNWVTVPKQSTLTIHGQTVLLHPIIDEYYDPAPTLDPEIEPEQTSQVTN